MKKTFLTIILSAFIFFAFGQDSMQLRVYFLYGSRPATGFRKTEKILFGGIHGGHVSLGFDSVIFSFKFDKCFHVIPHPWNKSGRWILETQKHFLADTTGKKYTVFEMPVTSENYNKLISLEKMYLDQRPYDYAFLGMRCASSTYDVLSQLGLFRHLTKTGNIISNFYPKLLRKKMFVLAKEKHYKVSIKQGRKSRVWEED